MLEYKYITDEDVEHLRITVTSHEMFNEVNDFNHQMSVYRMEKQKYDKGHFNYVLTNFLLLLVGIYVF